MKKQLHLFLYKILTPHSVIGFSVGVIITALFYTIWMDNVLNSIIQSLP